MSTPTPRLDDHQRDTLGRLLNPDTGQPYPSLTPADGADLAAYAEAHGITGDARDALVLLVLRARTRLAREHAARLRQQIDGYDANALAYADLATERYRQGNVDAGHAALADAARFAERARTLRGVAL